MDAADKCACDLHAATFLKNVFMLEFFNFYICSHQ